MMTVVSVQPLPKFCWIFLRQLHSRGIFSKVKNESEGPESITYSPETVPVIC